MSEIRAIRKADPEGWDKPESADLIAGELALLEGKTNVPRANEGNSEDETLKNYRLRRSSLPDGEWDRPENAPARADVIALIQQQLKSRAAAASPPPRDSGGDAVGSGVTPAPPIQTP